MKKVEEAEEEENEEKNSVVHVWGDTACPRDCKCHY